MIKKVAYLSAEFAVSPKLPTFAGGLGVLAADTLYQASDSRLPLVGVTLFYAAGCFNQWLDEKGNPQEECVKLDPKKADLIDTGVTVDVPFPDRTVYLRVWKKKVGNTAIYLLDSDVPENSEQDRTMAYRLYDGRVWPSHIERSFLLGVGGVRALRKLGEEISCWHINDDHAAVSILERIRELISEGEELSSARAKIKEQTVYTTHTPDLGAESIFGPEEIKPLLENHFRGLPVSTDELYVLGERKVMGGTGFSLTVLAMRHSRSINAVSQPHQTISRDLWKFVSKKPTINYITNGIYLKRWVADPMGALYKKYLSPDWDRRTDDPALWEKAKDIPDDALWQARQGAKKMLADEVYRRSGKKIDSSALILGFARRFVRYKQPTLPIADLKRLSSILCDSKQPVYLLMSGKIHPQDKQGRDLVRAVVAASRDPSLKEHLIYLENYNLDLARLLVSGTDVWLNTPLPGREACGTSGMKALYNGVLQAGTLDGWWVEAFKGKNGWEIKGPNFVESFYRLLESEIVPLFYRREGGIPGEWLRKVKRAIADLAPRYNTARMLKEYEEKVYGGGS